MAEKLEAKYGGGTALASRKIEYREHDDPMEVCFNRGWSDGLPVTPPTDERVTRMLKGTARAPQTVIGRIPPYLADCTVEKVAINAVLAGCRPEYMPVLLAALEAALTPLRAELNVGFDVLEDALCNWQKSPDEFKPFRG